MGPGLPTGASWLGYLVPMAAVVAVVVLRNSRPRRLRIETLWALPAVYVVLLGLALTEAPPPVTPLSIGLLILAAAVGAAIGWQRGRLMQIHIHPETHDMTSRASPIGIVFILGVLVLRYAARDLLAGNAGLLNVPVVAIGDAFIVLAVAMLSAQRIEVWRRASQMLAEARSASGPPPPSSIVS
jgi:hypothetical protein